jgi:hypothetical protein
MRRSTGPSDRAAASRTRIPALKADTIRSGIGTVARPVPPRMHPGRHDEHNGSRMIDEHDAEQERAGERQRAAEEPVPTDAPPAEERVNADELDLAEDAGLGEAERALLRWAFRQRQRALGEPLLPTGNEPFPVVARPAADPAPPPPPAARTAPAPPPDAGPAPALGSKPVRLWPEPTPEAPPVPAPGSKPVRLWPEPTPQASRAPEAGEAPAPEAEEAPAPEHGAAPAPEAEAAPAPQPALRPEAAPVPQPQAPTPQPSPPRPEAPPRRAEDQRAIPWERLHGMAEEAISALAAAGGPDPRDYASPRLDRRAKMLIAVALAVLFVVSVLGGFVGYRLTHRAAGAGPEAAGRPPGIHAAAPAPRSV